MTLTPNICRLLAKQTDQLCEVKTLETAVIGQRAFVCAARLRVRANSIFAPYVNDKMEMCPVFGTFESVLPNLKYEDRLFRSCVFSNPNLIRRPATHESYNTPLRRVRPRFAGSFWLVRKPLKVFQI